MTPTSTPPTAAAPAPAPSKLPRVSALTRRRLVFRLLYVLPFAAAAALLWWSVKRLRPVLKETAAVTERVNRVTKHVEEMEAAFARAEQAGVPQRFKEAIDSYVGGEDALRAWLGDLKDKATPLALEVTPQIGEPTIRDVGGQSVTLIPVQLDIRPSKDVASSRSPYQRVVEFCQFVAVHARRADLSEISVSGGDGNVAHAVLTLTLWARPPQT
jgi:hypothetical protein